MQSKWPQWQAMLAAITNTEDEELTCADLSDALLTEYAETALAGVDPGERFPRVRQHLLQCPTCTVQVNDLIEMLQLAQADALLEPLTQPNFDLSFLPAVQDEWVIPAAIAALFEGGRFWVRDQWDAFWLNVAAITTGALAVQPVLVTKGGQATPGEVIYRLSLGDEELGDLDVEVTAVREENPATCTLLVQAQVPSRWPELAGVEVVLFGPGETRTAITDENGQVVFSHFPIAELGQVRFRVAGQAGHPPA